MPTKRKDIQYTNPPVGALGLIPLKGIAPLATEVNNYLVTWRKDCADLYKGEHVFVGHDKDSFIINAETPRFGSGEGKGIIMNSVRGGDIYILVDVTNSSIEFKLNGSMNRMSPDDHFQDLKRIISAVGGKARRINIIMPFLYEGRQHRRTARESLDCALALQELVELGVTNIITFDAHDPRVCNAIPQGGFENIMPTYQFIKNLFDNVTDLTIDSDHLMVVSPDIGATERAAKIAGLLKVNLGMFRKIRDYSIVEDGRNPIIGHEFLGDDLDGKDIIVIDDMISSGESMIDVAKELKSRKANRVFLMSTFGLFTNGMDAFDKAYEEKQFDYLLTTNLTHQSNNLLSKPYYISCDMSKYLAFVIDILNHDESLGEVLNPDKRILKLVDIYKSGKYYTDKEEDDVRF